MPYDDCLFLEYTYIYILFDPKWFFISHPLTMNENHIGPMK